MNNIKSKHLTPMQTLWLILLAGVVIGFIAFAIVRFIRYTPKNTVHYHANYQVWVNGVQEKFVSPLNYQEEIGCNKDDSADPLHKTHMHENIYDVIHVHAKAVTWNNFFENINVGTEPTSLRIGNNVYQSNDTNKVSYILNGQRLSSLVGRVINSEDKLLINYGNEAQSTLEARDMAIENKAHEHNLEKDPASCGGGETPPWQERFRNIF